jgi:glycosyltransferase involved in cell wall biosynthesis
LDVLIGTPIHSNGTYIIDKFLSNQRQIQSRYPSSELVLASVEEELVRELEGFVKLWKLKGRVLHYEVAKPDHARSSIWEITAGREVIRQYMLSQTKADYLLFLDADMIVEPSVISIMKKEIEGYDVVFSGYPLRNYGIGLAGAGCSIIKRGVLEKLNFRCYEFKNGEVIFEDNVLEMDLFRLHSRVKKGFFLTINHFNNADNMKQITPGPVGVFRKLINHPLLRYGLIKTSIDLRYNIPWRLKIIISRFLGE